MTTLDDRLRQAHARHLAGDLQEAEARYRSLLEQSPGQPEVLRLLGSICGQSGRLDQAAWYLEQAIDADPSVAEAHYNLGVVRRRQGRTPEAIDAWTQATRANPAHASS